LNPINQGTGRDDFAANGVREGIAEDLNDRRILLWIVRLFAIALLAGGGVLSLLGFFFLRAGSGFQLWRNWGILGAGAMAIVGAALLHRWATRGLLANWAQRQNGRFAPKPGPPGFEVLPLNRKP
jgi:hypothetical protein